MDLTINERLASVETEVKDMRGDITSIAADVRAIRDVMLTDTGVRKGSWKTLTVIGGLVLGLAAFWHDIESVARKIFS